MPARHPAPPPAPARPPARVELLADCVVKTQDPTLARIEAEKSRRGAALGQASGLYSVPALVEVDPARGRLVFERVPAITPLRAHLAGPQRAPLLHRAAAALCDIHAGLALPPGLVTAASPALDGAEPPVFLHGDYSPTNVQVQADTGALWILDWSAPAWLPPRLGRGAPSFDLAAFVLPLFWQRPGDASPVPRPVQAARTFLDAWAACSGGSLGAFAAHARRLQPLRLACAAALVSTPGALARLPGQLACAAWLEALRDETGPRPDSRRPGPR